MAKIGNLMWRWFSLGFCLMIAYYGFLGYMHFNIFKIADWWFVLKESFYRRQIPTHFVAGIFLFLIVSAIMASFPPPLSWLKSKKKDQDDARWATPKDIKKMTPSLFKKHGVVLGKVKNAFGFDKWLVSDAPLSTMVVAPAGTGKTTGIVVPSILNSDDASLIINDPKGELYELTAKHRESLGKVFKIKWNANPKNSHCWNPVDLMNLPEDDGDIEDYVDRLSAVLIDDKKDDFWSSNARILISTVMLFLIFRARQSEESTTIFEVSKWISELDLVQEEQQKKGQKNKLHFAAESAKVRGYPQRIHTEMLYLAEIDHRTRSGVIGHVKSKLRIFSNSNVIKITSRSDFNLREIREMEGSPVTLYFNVPALDQETFGKLTGIFIECATQVLTLGREPKKKVRPIRMVLDEVAFLPAVNAINIGPAITRGYHISFMIVCQDYAQIRDKWGAGSLDNMITNTAFKIILTQNNHETCEKLSKMIGTYVKKKENVSKSKGGKDKGKSITEIEEITSLVKPQEIGNLKFGKQIVLVQSFMGRPILTKSPHYWSERRLKKRIENGV